MFDVDDFKHFNDQYGHDVGDAVLCGISDCMRKTFREGDILVRLGGDEFGIYIPEKIEEAAGRQKIQKLCDNIANLKFKQFEEKVSISAGIVFADENKYKSFDQIFKAADELMYARKRAKKGLS